MPYTPKGRRAAATPATSASDITFGGEAAKRAVALEDGEYLLECEHAEMRDTPKGATIVILTVKEQAEQQHVLLSPILVGSAGGDSNLTINGREMLATIANVGKKAVSADALIKRLTGAKFGAELRCVAGKDGDTVNRIVDAWLPESGEA